MLLDPFGLFYSIDDDDDPEPEPTQPFIVATGGVIRCEDCGDPVVTHGKRCGCDVRPGYFD